MKTLKRSKKVLSIVITILMLTLNVNIVFANETNSAELNIGNGSIELRENNGQTEYRQDSGSWTLYSENITITGSSQTDTITVESGTHNISLNNVNINLSEDEKCAFKINEEANANLTLVENSNNTLNSGAYRAGIEVEATSISNFATLVVLGSGNLSVTAGEYSAGIGGGNFSSAGKIVIDGNANVTANGSTHGAAIGSGADATNYGEIDIKGSSNVTANSNIPSTTLEENNSSYAAGIGGGTNSNSGEITISGYATVNAIGGTHGAGIGSGNLADSNKITITDNANVTASVSKTSEQTPSSYGACIGGGSSGNGGIINVGLNAQVTATQENNNPINVSYGSAIGGGNEEGGGDITISDNAIVSAVAGTYGAAIGGGNNITNGGNIDIKNQANVTAYGGTYGSAIGSGSLGTGANILIGSGAKVIAVSENVTKLPIEDTDNIVLAPSGESAANVLQLVYQQMAGANKETSVLDGTNEILSYSPTNDYYSIAFSDLELNKPYTVLLDGVKQQNNYSDEFILTTEGLTTYNYINPFIETYFTVTYRDSETEELLDTELVLKGEDAYGATLKLFRDQEYIQDFKRADLQNITKDTTLYYTLVDKEFFVTSLYDNLTITDYTGNPLRTTGDNQSIGGMISYNQIAKVKFTGPQNVIGWTVNGQLVSITPNKTYSFYVTEHSFVEPVFEGEKIATSSIEVGNVSYSTQDDEITKMYFPIVTTGIENKTEVRYGVIRSTDIYDVSEENVEQYLMYGYSNIVKEYTFTNVMNGDGRYNYVAVMNNKNTNLYMQAWAFIDGVLYMSSPKTVA